MSSALPHKTPLQRTPTVQTYEDDQALCAALSEYYTLTSDYQSLVNYATELGAQVPEDATVLDLCLLIRSRLREIGEGEELEEEGEEYEDEERETDESWQSESGSWQEVSEDEEFEEDEEVGEISGGPPSLEQWEEVQTIISKIWRDKWTPNFLNLSANTPIEQDILQLWDEVNPSAYTQWVAYMEVIERTGGLDPSLLPFWVWLKEKLVKIILRDVSGV